MDVIWAKESVKKWINIGLEAEFQYNGKSYYIGPLRNEEENKIGIMFYEYYQDEIEVKDADELRKSKYRGLKVSDILNSVPENLVDGRIWF